MSEPLSDAGPVCGGCSGPLEAHVQAAGSRWVLQRCVRCGSARLVTTPSSGELEYPIEYYRNRHGFTAGFCVRRRVRHLEKLLGGTLRGRMIMDVGSGQGELLKAVEAKGGQAVGVELDPSGVPGSGPPVVGSIGEAAEFGRFDAITFWHSLEHHQDPGQAVRSARAALKENGWVVVAVPNFDSWQARLFGSRWFHLDLPRHVHHFTRMGVESLLASVDLRVRYSDRGEIEYNLFGWLQSGLTVAGLEPHSLFDALTMPKGAVSPAGRLLSVLAGILMAPVALVGTGAEQLARRTGTMTVSATRGVSPG